MQPFCGQGHMMRRASYFRRVARRKRIFQLPVQLAVKLVLLTVDLLLRDLIYHPSFL